MAQGILMSANDAALIAVCVLGAIVAWDAYSRADTSTPSMAAMIPNLGELPNGGFAWTSEGPQEVVRQWGNLASMAAMMAFTMGPYWRIRYELLVRYNLGYFVITSFDFLFLFRRDSQLLLLPNSFVEYLLTGSVMRHDWKKNWDARSLRDGCGPQQNAVLGANLHANAKTYRIGELPNGGFLRKGWGMHRFGPLPLVRGVSK